MDGCCGPGCCSGQGRSFLTRGEKLELLEEYRKNLALEAKGVEERIKALKSQN